MGGPRLQYTKDYSLFELHEFNRHLHKDRTLEQSMKEHGFMPSSPLQCVRIGNGKLKIIRGHHRFATAKGLGIGVWYVVDETNTELFKLEACKSQWSIKDFADARAHAGDEDCIKLLDFMAKHKLPIGAATALMAGSSASSGSKTAKIRNGTFQIADLKHANQVVRITDRGRELNIPFVTSSAFVCATSLCLRVPEFDLNRFFHSLELNGTQMRKRGTTVEYLDEIEALYNYGKRVRQPIAFRAKEISRQRQETFFKPKTKNENEE
jgi:hypothetical protein